MAQRPRGLVAQPGELAHVVGDGGTDGLRRLPGLATLVRVVARAEDPRDRVVVDRLAAQDAPVLRETGLDRRLQLDDPPPQLRRDLVRQHLVVQEVELPAYGIRRRRSRARRGPRRTRRRLRGSRSGRARSRRAAARSRRSLRRWRPTRRGRPQRSAGGGRSRARRRRRPASARRSGAPAGRGRARRAGLPPTARPARRVA